MNTPRSDQRNFTRRHFIGANLAAAFAAATYPAIVPSSALGRGGQTAPSNRITLGIIGCGPQGRGNLGNFLNQADCQVLAACDVKADQLRLAVDAVNGKYQKKDCKGYNDFRELVARKDIDTCLIATPDHWHVLTALAAVNSGKDIYLEKPLGLSLEEGQVLRKAVHRNKRIFQFGTQQRSDRKFRFASELVRNGRIGKLQHINVWAPGSAPGGSLKQVAPPPGLDYDLWLGAARYTPHTENRCTDDGSLKTWWFISDFALGFIAGWGIHPVDIALWGGGDLLGGSVEVEGRGTFRTTEGICNTATVWDVDFKFASGVTMKFVGVPNGGNQNKPTGDPWVCQKEWSDRYRNLDTHGTAFEGDNGWVHVDRSRIQAKSEELIEIKEDTFATQFVRSSNHARNFLDCVKSRAETLCPIDAAVTGDIMCHIADIAIRLERRLTFNFKTEKFVNDDAANLRLQARAMRKPWHL